jgi:hypothetical protein
MTTPSVNLCVHLYPSLLKGRCDPDTSGDAEGSVNSVVRDLKSINR